MEETKKEEHIVKIIDIKKITHDVLRFRVERPENYNFIPGQATEVSINTLKLKNEKRPFTFTCLPDSPFLEFTIKSYAEHESGVTKHLPELNVGDSLIIREVWGAIHYSGPGVFIAGGAGITPFVAILRNLRKQRELQGNTLIFSNKKQEDIILESEFNTMKKEGLKVIYTLTRELKEGYENKRINEEFLKKKIQDFSQSFYICGPVRMVGELTSSLQKLGANPDSIVIET